MLALKKKLIIYIDSYRIGGMHKQVLYLCRHLDRDKFSIVLCTSSSSGNLKREFENTKVKLIDLGWRKSFDFRVLKNLIRTLYSERPDIIFITEAQNLIYYNIAKLFYWKKIVQIGSFRALSFWKQPTSKSIRMVDNFLAFWLYKTSNRVVVNSFNMSEHYSTIVRENKKKPLKIIYNGSDFDFPVLRGVDHIRKEINLEKDEILILFLARLDPWKDFETLFEAVKVVITSTTNFKIIIIGDGELKDNLTKNITAHNLSDYIFLIGEKPNPYEYINACDISILSTHGEGFSNTILESMSFSKPVIATNVGGNKEIIGVDNQAGFLVEHKSHKDLADKIKLLINDPELRRTIGNAAEKKIKLLCNLEKFISAYEEVFSEN